MKCDCGKDFKLVESTIDGVKKWICETCGSARITSNDGREYLTSDVPKPKRRYLVEG